jgi:tripartite-type tricarboxylate transporter receptor subunit TctC
LRVEERGGHHLGIDGRAQVVHGDALSHTRAAALQHRQRHRMAKVGAVVAGGHEAFDRAGRRRAGHRVGASAQGSSDDDARPGAGGAIEARFVKTAPADGSILPFMNSQMLVTLPLTTRDPGHDPARDFRPLGQIATLPVAVVVPTGTFKTLR